MIQILEKAKLILREKSINLLKSPIFSKKLKKVIAC